MTGDLFPVPSFPLVVSAATSRAAAVVLVDRPLSVPDRFTVKPARVGRVRENLASLFHPVTLVHVNGTRWTLEPPAARPKGVLAVTVRAACEFLGIEPTRFAIVERLLDAYPGLEPRLLPLRRATIRTDRVRAAQPLLAALIVAHACSVAHLVEHG